MTGFYKGKAVKQIDTLLCEGKMYSLNDVCEIIRKHNIEPTKKGKKRNEK